jgi:hypothetical protein
MQNLCSRQHTYAKNHFTGDVDKSAGTWGIYTQQVVFIVVYQTILNYHRNKDSKDKLCIEGLQ